MRLTDVPRSLAEVRPDVQWPEAVQATLDLALARDAKDRYQSAAQFGREFAAALAEMPAHATDEAGTVVMSAPAATVARTPVPSTRVGGRAGTTAGAPPARGGTTTTEPAAKSKTPLALGGVGAALAIAVVAWKMGLIGGGAAPVPPTSAATDSSVAPATVATAEQGTAPAVPVSPAGGTQLMSNAAPSTNATQAAPTAGTRPAPSTPVPSSQPKPSATPATTTANAAPTSAPAPAPSAAPAAPSPMTQLEGWLREVQAPSTTAATARRVLGDVQQLQGSLSGVPLAESYYVQMIAYTKLEDEVGVCRAARQVRSLHNERPRITLATRAIELFGCENP